ncbi:discoidin domain-containing protein [Dysgonomonas sp. 520]|uniref:discoidin domain-containing protein n=1 Tax=Dysgonomonas sp. 520 TaxID=2302931 RepID=UPI0013D018FB|nr:discoidin domain-containing protein [Dysgonomonas sp. 520]
MAIAIILFANQAFGQTNIALNATASTPDGETVDGSNSSNVIDGDEGTYWQSTASFKRHIILDLGKKYDVSRIVLKWDGVYYPTTIDICYSNTPITVDGSNNIIAENIKGFNSYNSPGDGPITDTFEDGETVGELTSVFSGFTAQYVAIQTRGRNMDFGGDHFRLKEFEVYGVEATEDISGNIAKLKPVSACFNPNNCNATANGSNPSNAVDGNGETYWESISSASNIFFCVDLQKEYEISKIVVKWEGEAYPDGTTNVNSRMSIGYSTTGIINSEESLNTAISFAYPRDASSADQVDVFGADATNPLFLFDEFTARYVALRMKRLGTIGYIRVCLNFIQQ